MRWPPWSSKSTSKDDEGIKPSVSWTDSLNATDWTHYTDPRTVIPTILLTGTTLLLVRLYRSYLRRIPGAANIQPGFFRRRSLFGRVTSVGDGDNFRLFHTPGGRLTGWEWMPGRKVPNKREELKDRTVRSKDYWIRICEEGDFLMLVDQKGPHPPRRHRRARTRPLRPPFSALLQRSAHLAHRVCPASTRARLRLQA